MSIESASSIMHEHPRTRWTLPEIFLDNDNWINYLMEHKDVLRRVEIEEVEKMLKCSNGAYGYSTYKCKDCQKTFTVPFTCKSRLCTHCGKKYADQWAGELSLRMFDVTHRHMVFTIAHTLRQFFEKDRSHWKVIMDSVNDTMVDFMNYSNKTDGLRPGIICVFHPYGKDLKFNPHVHVIITEGGLTKDDKWMDVNYFDYDGLRKSWQYHILTNLKKAIPNTRENRDLINSLFKNRENGFYVYAKNVIESPKEVAKYIGRYVRHPAIAESRISDYNGKTVTFYYEKDDGERVDVSMSVMEFIGRIIKFVPDRQFKMIRHFGLYSRRAFGKAKKIMEELKLYNLERVKYLEALIKNVWTLKCPECGGEVELIGKQIPVLGET